MKQLAAPLLAIVLLTIPIRAEKREPVAPWTAFHRGNELLRQAREAGKEINPAWLLQAEQHYRACLSCEAATRDAGTLFDDARYNLELTKLLRMQIDQTATNAATAKPSTEQSPSTPDKKTPMKDKKDGRANDGKKEHSPGEDQGKAKINTPSRRNAEKNGDSEKQAEKQSKQTNQALTNATCEKCENAASPGNGKNQQSKQTSQALTNSNCEQCENPNSPGSGKNPRNSQNQGQESPTPQPGGSTPHQTNQSGEQTADSGVKPKKEAKGEQSIPGPGNAPGKGEPNASGVTEATLARSESTFPGGAANHPAKRGNGGTQPASEPAEQDQRGGRGQEPGADGLFHPETPDPMRQRPGQPGRGPNGNTRGSGGQSKNEASQPGQDDPTMQAAVMRLQQAIKRIQSQRARRAPHADSGGEDPAHLKRYRDW